MARRWRNKIEGVICERCSKDYGVFNTFWQAPFLCPPCRKAAEQAAVWDSYLRNLRVGGVA